jgi:5,5'-dehydrodivanillate O-demethylase oxygenase subunit
LSEPVAKARPEPKEFGYTETGPGTLAGRYLRQFWQPVFHAVDLAPGRTAPLRIMGEDFTLYRGETSGTIFLTEAACPHRAARLAAGWVEGDAIRCFYHGWKFGADGQCIEQPPEESSFCAKVAIRSYPVRQYLGLVFAYLGEGEPPEFPLYPQFERFAGLVEVDSYFRPCNYFQNLENALDMSHVAFVHRDNMASFARIGLGRQLQAAESEWGATYTFTRDDGKTRVQQFGMPNIFYMTALPNDPDIGWQESLFWWVPIDDDRHMQFSIHRVPATGQAAQRIRDRRQQRRARIDLAHQEVCRQVLTGKIALRDVDPERVDMVRLQDDIAQIGQGRIAKPERERLGRADIGVVTLRRLWRRELGELASGGALKRWVRRPELVPEAWGFTGFGGRAIGDGGAAAVSAAEIIDVRPHVEMEIQLAELRNPRGIE